MARFLIFANRLTTQASVNVTSQGFASMLPARRTSGGFTHLAPYWVVYTTTAKGRWLGRTVLDVLSSEFRERSEAYYKCAIDAGATTVNGKLVSYNTVLRGSDVLENISHSHEPPVLSTPIRVIHEDEEQEFIVIDKPASIPVHPTGRYYYHTVVEILRREHGFDKLYTVNRLDRHTSGLMIIPTSLERSKAFATELSEQTVRKEYLARVKGRFPAEEVVCDQPLFIADKQIGLTLVDALKGKPSKTVFRRLRHDAHTDTSVVLCKPVTGRCHQIRVHLQYLGHPIANDIIYAEPRIWGPALGKGGALPPNGRFVSRSKDIESLAAEDGITPKGPGSQPFTASETLPNKPERPSAPTSDQSVDTIIADLRSVKAAEGGVEPMYWPRFRQTILAAKATVLANDPRPSAPLPQRREGFSDDAVPSALPQYSPDKALTALDRASVQADEADFNPETVVQVEEDGIRACTDCRRPLKNDPDIGEMCIYLHALRYHSPSMGTYETEQPEWAYESWRPRSRSDSDGALSPSDIP